MCQLAVDRHLRAAEQRRGQREADAADAERLVLAERDADGAEHEGADQHEVQERPHVGQRIQRPQLGHGEDRRIVEADHRAEADEAERGGEGPR